MSESQNYEEVTVASDGVTVIKTFEADAFPVPAIAFRIKSDRTESVTVKIVDDVPENVAVEDLGFHPEYGSEYWTIEDDKITFERDIDADEQYTTVYGIRATGTDDVEQFLTQPEIANVDPPLEDDDGVVGEGGSDVVRDVISGNTDSVPGLDEEGDEESQGDDIEKLDLTDPNADEQSAQAAAKEDADTDDQTEEVEPASTKENEDDGDQAKEDTSQPAQTTNGTSGTVQSVAAALAAEIREGNVDDDDLAVLRDELDLGNGSTGSAVDARIEKLQTDISDLEAYIDALEEFLNEAGKGQDIINNVQDQLEEIHTQMDTAKADIEENTGTINSLEGNIDSIKADLQSLKGDIKDVNDEISTLHDGVESLEDDVSEVDEITGDVSDIESDIEELQQWREQLSNVLGAQGE